MLRHQSERALDDLLERLHQLRTVGAVDRAVVEAAGRRHDGRARNRVIDDPRALLARSEEHTSELQSLMRISYAVFCFKQKNTLPKTRQNDQQTQQCLTHTTI